MSCYFSINCEETATLLQETYQSHVLDSIYSVTNTVVWSPADAVAAQFAVEEATGIPLIIDVLQTERSSASTV